MANKTIKQNIPKGWKVAKLGDIVSVTTGGRDANHGSPDGAYPFFTCAQKVSKIDDYSFDTEAVLIAGNGDFNVKYYKGKFDAYQRTYVLSDFKNTSGDFVYHKAKQALNNIVRNNQGSSVKFIKKGDLTDYEFLLPPVKEQQKIAGILEAVDADIEETKSVIKATEKLKKGLVSDLIISHLDADGGERLGDFLGRHGGIVQTGPFGSQLHSYEYTEEGVPVIMPKDMNNGRVNLESIAKISEEKAQQLSRHRVKVNDLVFSRRGDIGRAVAISESEKGWLCGTGCLLMRVSKKYLDSIWFTYVYLSEPFQKQLYTNAVGTTMKNLNTTVVGNIKVHIPTIDEQEKTAKVLLAVDEKIQVNKKLLAKQTELKKGLMQDLLSGKVRVTN